MNILAFDTSSPWCSVALQLDSRAWARETLAGHKHSELILPMIEVLLNEAGIRLTELDAIAFGAGPGSFTGLRIACGVAQGLAFGADIPVAGVSTLLALAEASGAQRVISMVDARMGDVYCAAYERSGGGWLTVYPPQLCAAGSAPPVEGTDWTGAGSGFEAHGDALAQRYAGQLKQIRPELYPHAREIARLGADMVSAGLAVPPDDAQPLYLRDRVALTVEERQAIKAQKAKVGGDDS